jgi:hypothetical protein
MKENHATLWTITNEHKRCTSGSIEITGSDNSGEKKRRHMEIKVKDLKARMAIRRNREADEN